MINAKLTDLENWLMDTPLDRRYETQIIVLHTYFIIETFMK